MEVARNVLLTFARPGQDGRSRGSGFHLRENLVLTADHCADGGDYQVWQSGNVLAGRVAWRSGDASVDLALLEVEGLPEVEPMSLAVLDTAAGGVLDDCTCGCYPSFGRLDPSSPRGTGGPDRLVPLTGNLLLDSAHVARVPDGWARDGRLAFSLTSDRSLLPDVRGTAGDVTRAWSAASGGAVLATVAGRRFCVGVISARQVKETPTALRVAGFGLLEGLGPEAGAGFWDRVGLPGPAGLATIGGTVRTEQVVVGQIPRRAPGYVDRDVTAALLAQIADHGTASGTVTPVSLAGLRGVGKSQAAGELSRHGVRQGWPVVAWVNAETRGSALSDLRLLADRLGAVVDGEPPEDSVRRLYSAWAADRATRRLVVFDNLVDRNDVDGLLPPEASAAVIVTTADRSIAIGDVLDVGVFTSEQAVAYLQDGSGLTEPEAAGRVALELGRLPLALAGAVWAIMRRRRLDQEYRYDQYLEDLRRQPLARLLGNRKATPEYPRATIAALALAAEEAVEAAEDRELVRSVLSALAFLDPGGVPRRWFRALGESFDVDDALAVIADSGLAQPSADTTSVIMHRLVARVIREMSQRDDWASPTDAAAGLVRVIVPLDREGFWAQRAEAAALARHVLALVGDSRPDADEGVILAGVLAGRSLVELSDPHAAITVLRPLSSMAERVLGADDPVALASRINLAGAYRSVGSVRRAISLYEEALADVERVLGADHRATLSSRAKLAGAYRSVGDSHRAISLYEEILADVERVMGADHPDTLSLRGNLAGAYESVGDVRRAISLDEETLADRERVLGADHPDTLSSRNNLAGAYELVGDVRRAISLYEETLADRERVLGADHPATLTSRSNLAGAYESVGDARRAILLHEKTLEDRKRVLGADHPDTLSSRNNLAYAHLAAGDTQRAVMLHEETLADTERVLGVDHPNTLTSRSNLAGAYESAGDVRRAILLHEKTLEDRKRVLGAHHPDTLMSRNNLAYAFQSAGEPRRAVALYEETLADRVRILGADHPNTLTSRGNLAVAVADVVALDDADADAEKALDLARLNAGETRRLFGAEDSRSLDRRNTIAFALLAAGRAHEAVELLTGLLADCRRILGDHATTRAVEKRLAHAVEEAAT